MSPTETLRRFQTADKRGDLCEPVALARAYVMARLRSGEGFDMGETTIHVEGMIGPWTNRPTGNDMWFEHCERLRVAFALGVACGQLLHADVFTGAR